MSPKQRARPAPKPAQRARRQALAADLRRLWNENQEDDTQPAISFRRYVEMLACLPDDEGAREYLGRGPSSERLRPTPARRWA